MALFPAKLKCLYQLTLLLYGDVNQGSKIVSIVGSAVKKAFVSCVMWQYLSWTTIVVHSLDDEGVALAHKIVSPKNQPQFSYGVDCLGKTN